MLVLIWYKVCVKCGVKSVLNVDTVCVNVMLSLALNVDTQVSVNVGPDFRLL